MFPLCFQAHINWAATDQSLFTIKVHDGTSRDVGSDVIDLHFMSNTSHVILIVAEKLSQQVALVTGSGSRTCFDASQIFVLLWFSAILGNWRHIVIMTVIILISLMTHVFAETLVHMGYNEKRKLVIDIWAPR